MLAGAERRWDEAERCFEVALALNRRYELPWDEAKTLFEWGRIARARGHGVDRERGRQRFGVALKICQRIEAAREAEAARAALDETD